MPRLDDPSTKVKKAFSRKTLRPWDDMEEFMPKNISINNEENNKEQNILKEKGKTKKEQTGHKLNTNRTQTGHKLDTN